MTYNTADLLTAALDYAARELPVVPLEARGKAPAGRLVPHGFKDATTDLAVIRSWWAAMPDANVGIRTGHPLPGGGVLAVLDVDPRDGGDVTLDALLAKHGRLPRGPEVRSGGGDWHHYFAAPEGTRCGKAGRGLDRKACGGFVVAPPSIHASGQRYAWHDERPLGDLAELPAMPAWALAKPRAAAAERTATARPVTDRRPDDDPLREIPATEFVFELTGREPDARGFVRCPLHGGGEERTPSMALYGPGSRDPHKAPGWHCFACGVGGSIYDLAGRLGGYPVPLRGAAFLTVQATLMGHFGAKAAAA